MTSLTAQKARLRQLARATLRSLSRTERAAAGTNIVRTLSAWPAWQKARCVLAFQPLPTEPDISFWWQDGFPPDKDWVFPRVTGSELELVRVSHPDDFQPGRYGILEPRAAPENLVPPSAIDLALVPGLAFDETGGRLGRGRGYYDRLLSRTDWQALTVGVAFLATRQFAVPCETTDRRLAHILWSDGRITPSP